MRQLNNFNLLVSSSRFNEVNSKAELWFTLLMCGDEYPIISDLEFMGLITAMTSLNAKDVISKIKDILINNPNFFSYILKIIPIDFVCQTDVKIINQIIAQHYDQYIDKGDTFRIVLKRRKGVNEIIERNSFIKVVAKNIENQVNLENPDKIIRFDILGNYTGISFLKNDDILKIRNKYNPD